MAKRYDPILCMMVDEPTKAQDGILFYQLRFSSGRTEGAKLDESEIRSYAEALLEKYGEKQVAVSRQGKIVATYLNAKAKDANKYVEQALKWMKEGKGRLEILSGLKQMGLTPTDAVKYYAEANMELGYKYSFKDSTKVADENTYRVEHSDVPGSKRNYSYVKANSENEAANKVEGVVYSVKKVQDFASTLDKAISTCDAASGDTMKQIVSTAKSWARQYNQIFEKATTAEEVEKAESQKNNDYRRAIDNLDKIYNEVSQTYGHSRNEIRAMFDEVGSNALKAYRRVTGGKK